MSGLRHVVAHLGDGSRAAQRDPVLGLSMNWGLVVIVWLVVVALLFWLWRS